MFNTLARTMRGIRAASEQELIDRIHLSRAVVNSDPTIIRWKYKMDEIGII
jgi:hypothetical protein